VRRAAPDAGATCVTGGACAHGAIAKPIDIRFSTALAPFAGMIPANPAGLAMSVKSLRVYLL
jgi:hypothetical protein